MNDRDYSYFKFRMMSDLCFIASVEGLIVAFLFSDKLVMIAEASLDEIDYLESARKHLIEQNMLTSLTY